MKLLSQLAPAALLLAWIIFCALVLPGCVSSGTQVADSALTQFESGRTTEAQVVHALGMPQAVSEQGGERYLTYAGAHAQAKAANFIPIVGLFAGGASVQSSAVVFHFNAAGVLQDWSATHVTNGAVYGPSAGYVPPSPAPQVVK